MKKNRTFSALLAAALGLGMLAGCGVNVEKATEQANEAAETGDYATAIEQYEKVLEAEPDNAEVRMALCMAQVRANPTDPSAWETLIATIDELDWADEIPTLLEELRDKHPTDNQEIRQLLWNYRPNAPHLVYRGTGGRDFINDGDSYEQIIEAAVLMPPTSGGNPDSIRYSINGKETSEHRYPCVGVNDFDGIESLLKNHHVYFSTPGTYKVEMTCTITSYALDSNPAVVTFSIPADCVGTVDFSVPGGVYPTLGGVDVTTNHPDSTIYFTTDGTDPVQWDEYGYPTISGKICGGSVPLDVGTTTVSARCVNSGGIVGELAQATYEVQSNHTKIVYSGRFKSTSYMADDGRYIYLATAEGLYRYDYDGSHETKLYDGICKDIDILDTGEYFFCATPETNPNRLNDPTRPFYIYWGKNGVIESKALNGATEVHAVGNTAYYGGGVYYIPEISSGESRLETEAQKEAALYNDEYNVYYANYVSPYYQIEISDPDGSNRRVVAQFHRDSVGHVSYRALMGSKLLYCTYYQETYRGKNVGDPVYHYYVLDLATGEQHGCPELEERQNAINHPGGVSHELDFIGFTEDAAYYRMPAGQPVNDADVATSAGCARMTFNW